LKNKAVAVIGGTLGLTALGLLVSKALAKPTYLNHVFDVCFVEL